MKATQPIRDEHRRLYPEQYKHRLCGARVTVTTAAGVQGEGIVERVAPSRFGQLALVPAVSADVWWLVSDCKLAE